MQKIGIVSCSDGLGRASYEKTKLLENTLLSMGLSPVFSNCIYVNEDGHNAGAKERAQALMDFYGNHEIKGIFDISGGDIANGILPYLDYGVIAGSSKMLWGYSDLTTVLNGIYAKTGKESVLYQVRNLISGHGEEQKANFAGTFLGGGKDLFRIRYRFLQKKEMGGVIVGGNIRCFLKLAGTEFLPDLQDKILLLESCQGDPARIETYLRQLQQMGAFKKAAGILLGTFTQMEREQCVPTVETLVKEMAGGDLPIAVTGDIGHGTDAKGIIIGRKVYLEESCGRL